MPTITPSEIIDGVVIIEPQLFGDERGYFVETYRREWFPQGREMIQGNRGNRIAGCLVGLHYHLHQADYWYVPFGHARVVLHDLRSGGPTDGATECFDISGENHLGVFIPPGVAHGFAALRRSMRARRSRQRATAPAASPRRTASSARQIVR